MIAGLRPVLLLKLILLFLGFFVNLKWGKGTGSASLGEFFEVEEILSNIIDVKPRLKKKARVRIV